jgi:signal transduction histidine kinase
LRHFLIAIVALVLVAVLAYLYDKTQAVDLGERNVIAAKLDTLREIDSRWDIDVLRQRTELEPSGAAAPPNRTATAIQALASLTAAVPRADSAALRSGMGTLAKAIYKKADLVEKFMAESTRTRTALLAVLSGAAALGSPAGAPPSGDARQRELEQAVNQLVAVVEQYYWLGKAAPPMSLEMAAARVQELAAGVSDSARDQAVAMQSAIRVLLQHKPAEEELFDRLSSLSSGPRLQQMRFALNRELETTLQTKERFRVYLLAYAAALLIGIGYLGVRLKAANEGLERRVAERTRELSEALRHLKESEAQLIQSEKMSSLGQMVAGVAHEINTPLAYVKNSLGTVSERLPQITAAIEDCEKLLALLGAGNADAAALNRQFAQTSALLGRIKQQRLMAELGGLVKDGLYGTGEMAEIVGNLKDFSRLDRSKVSSFNVNDGLASSLGLARHMLKSVKVNRQFGEIPAITCAPSQINQVFLNLITNAAQALPAANGEITLTTRAQAEGVVVEVADNGKGIPPDVLPKIFDPFFTTKEVGKGTGLGLSISHKIVEQHGGRIKADSQAGKGTRFTVWLPLKPPAEAKLAA